MSDRSESQSISKQYDSSNYEGKYDEVKQKFDSFDPSPINEACNAWSGVAGTLGGVADNLHASAGQKLFDAWESDASARAQHHLQIAQATARALADQCMQMARATDSAYQYANWYKTHFPGDGYVQTHADHQRAVEHEVGLLNRYNEVIGILPSQVRAQYVDTSANLQSDNFTKGGGGGSGLPGGGHGGIPGGGSPGVGVHNHPGPGLPHVPGGGIPGGGDPHPPGGGPGIPGGGGPGLPGGSPYDPNSALAGGGGVGGIGSPGGLGSGGLGTGGLGSGGGPGGLGSGLGPGAGGGAFGAGTAGAGAGGGRAGGSGAGGRAAGAGTGRGGTGTGVAGSPMHGGRGGEQEERERSTWLTEDEDVWGGDTDAPPPVIGG
jgi:hypothetical protein